VAEVAQQHGAALTEALAHIDRVVEASMAAQATPGLALAITDRERVLARRNYGYADLAALEPIDDDTLFEFGSIGKSFTAICLLQLAEEGLLDLHAPVTTYLPWFAVRSAYEPITIHHLLTHTAGLIQGSDFALDQRYEVWALRNVEVAPPGQKARYSNVGYKLLGLILEAIAGKPYGDLVAERIFAPLGMASAAASITNDLRRRLAVGYVPFYDDRPWRPAHGFAPAPWLETNTADGCLSATAADLATYLRMLLNGGVGPHGRLLSEESFALLTAPHTEIADGGPYGYGLAVGEKEGRQRIGHHGGMVGYISTMLGDPEAGIGVVVFKNAMQNTSVIAELALRTVVNALAGAPLPEPLAELDVSLADYAGVYRSGASSIEIAVESDRLVLRRGDETTALETTGYPPTLDVFLADRPDLALYPIRFGRDSLGSVVEVLHGGDWYVTDDYEGATTFEIPATWAAFPGHYRDYNPWGANFRVVLRKGSLLLIHPDGEEQALTPDGESFRIGDDPESPERIAFDTIVDGQAWRAVQPGGEIHYRFFTP
jgi:D-alanyl-D-alanine carboxypeptidase